MMHLNNCPHRFVKFKNLFISKNFGRRNGGWPPIGNFLKLAPRGCNQFMQKNFSNIFIFTWRALRISFSSVQRFFKQSGRIWPNQRFSVGVKTEPIQRKQHHFIYTFETLLYYIGILGKQE